MIHPFSRFCTVCTQKMDLLFLHFHFSRLYGGRGITPLTFFFVKEGHTTNRPCLFEMPGTVVVCPPIETGFNRFHFFALVILFQITRAFILWNILSTKWSFYSIFNFSTASSNKISSVASLFSDYSKIGEYS